MRVQRFTWDRASDPEAAGLAAVVRRWARGPAPDVSLGRIEADVAARGDAALVDLTAKLDATGLIGPDEDARETGERWRRPDGRPWSPRVAGESLERAREGLDSGVAEALEVSIANVEMVARSQLREQPADMIMPQGHEVAVRDVPVDSAGIYVPGGGASYPSSLVMAAVPARVAGVRRLAVATPPGPDGDVDETVLAAAALCGVDEVHAVGGAQAIYALARGTSSVAPVDVIAGPGNDWVQAAKRAVFGEVGIDSIAGPSELMVIAGPDTDPRLAGLDLCAQAEHGDGGLLLVASTDGGQLERIASQATSLAAERAGVADAPLALVEVDGGEEEVAQLAEAIAPEHLQIDLDRSRDDPDLPGPRTRRLASGLRRPGCVFAGPMSATAFGDYVAGSNHILPTGGTGRFTGPLGPSTFRKPIANVVLGRSAGRALSPHLDALARVEGLAVHGESARERLRPPKEAGARPRNET